MLDASPELQADREVVMEAVKNKGYALRYASPDLHVDEELRAEINKQIELKRKRKSEKETKEDDKQVEQGGKTEKSLEDISLEEL